MKKKVQNFIIFMDQKLGKGKYATVYKGLNTQNNVQVAIKVFAKNQLSQQDRYLDYVTETQILGNLNSDYIVKFIKSIETKNNFYLIQQYCNGGDLRSALKLHTKFPQGTCIKYLESICIGFSQLLANKMIHRDIKPENLLIHNNQLKISDFGFAKNIKSNSALHQTKVGSPLYMSPQILTDENYSSKCDVWSTGLIFYEMLIGKFAWNCRSEYQLIQNILNKPLIIPESIQISQQSRSFIQGCLKLQEADRYSWDQIFEHPIFKNRLSDLASESQKLKHKVQPTIHELKDKMNENHINLQKLFQDQNLINSDELDQQQFIKLLRTIDVNITMEQAGNMFKLIDKYKNGTISIHIFKEFLIKNQIRIKPLNPIIIKKKPKNLQEQNNTDHQSKYYNN